jgi:hypothetical protein
MKLFGVDLDKMAKDFVASVKAKFSALDLDKNGKADLAEVLADLQKVEAAASALAAKFPPAAIEAVLMRDFPGCLSPGEFAKLTADLALAGPALQKAVNLVSALETVL